MENYTVEGNIIYPDMQMLTWGPFYYHQLDMAKHRVEDILSDITDWVNMKDPTLNIRPDKLIRSNDGRLIAFKIKAWKDDVSLEECNGIIAVERISFEDDNI